MTFLALAVYRERVLVGADCRAIEESGTMRRVDKIWMMPALSSIVSGRGLSLATNLLALGLAEDRGDVDRIEAELEAFRQKAANALSGARAALSKANLLDMTNAVREGQFALVAGWSGARARMVSVTVDMRPGEDAFDAPRVTIDDHFATWPVEISEPALPSPTSLEELAQIGREQHRRLVARFPKFAGPNEYLCCEFTRDSTRTVRIALAE